MRVILLILSILSCTSISAQTLNKPMYDYNKVMHFGFTLGFNVLDFQYEYNDDFYRNDTLLRINSTRFPGFHLGAVANLHLGEHFDLRFVPTLILNQRTLEYYFSDGSIDEKDVESVFLHAPVHLKFKSIRHQNIRVYVIGGGSFSYDMASNFEAEKNPFDPFVAVYPNNINYEFGIGLDLYFEYFKFSPEIKISRGLNDVLVPDPGSVYTESFNQMYSNFIMVSFMFE